MDTKTDNKFTKNIEDMTFEEAYKELEEITSFLTDSSVNLSDSMVKYKRSKALLDKAKLELQEVNQEEVD